MEGSHEAMRILVVDDERIVLESCKRVLGERFEVSLAKSSHEALEAMGRETFSLILVDIKMPGKDGMTLMRKVKEQWPEIPVIMMTGYVTVELMEEVAKTKTATFLAKPFTPDELLQAVDQVLTKEEGHGRQEEGAGDRR
jgi:DNA-binding NtrC family response regulator